MTTKFANADILLPLKQLCDELKVDPREVWEKLRIAVRVPKKYPELKNAHAPRQPWPFQTVTSWPSSF